MRIPCSDEIGSLLKYQAIVSLALVVLQVSQTACPISPYSMLLLVELTTGAAPEQVNTIVIIHHPPLTKQQSSDTENTAVECDIQAW